MNYTSTISGRGIALYTNLYKQKYNSHTNDYGAGVILTKELIYR